MGQHLVVSVPNNLRRVQLFKLLFVLIERAYSGPIAITSQIISFDTKEQANIAADFIIHKHNANAVTKLY